MVFSPRSDNDEAIQILAQAIWIASLTLAMTRVIPFSQRGRVRALPTTTLQEFSPPRGRRSAERRMSTMCRASQTSARERAPFVCCAAARHIGARPPSGASTAALAGTPIPAQLQAMLPGIENQAGVTRSILSQFSGSTPRLGRSTEGNDARSRSGAACEPARKHRTRSTLQIASGMRPSDERDFAYVS